MARTNGRICQITRVPGGVAAALPHTRGCERGLCGSAASVVWLPSPGPHRTSRQVLVHSLSLSGRGRAQRLDLPNMGGVLSFWG